LIQKGANKTIKDSKGRTPYELAIEKNKTSLVQLLKTRTNCQICNFKAPMGKVDKSRLNIYLFFIIHFVIELLVFTMILPCNIH
jgi:hypothetical protein